MSREVTEEEKWAELDHWLQGAWGQGRQILRVVRLSPNEAEIWAVLFSQGSRVATRLRWSDSYLRWLLEGDVRELSELELLAGLSHDGPAKDNGRYRSTPAVGQATGVLQADFSDVVYVGKASNSRGSILVFRATKRGRPVLIHVGRASGDRLDIRWKFDEAKSNPREPSRKEARRKWAHWLRSPSKSGALIVHWIGPMRAENGLFIREAIFSTAADKVPKKRTYAFVTDYWFCVGTVVDVSELELLGLLTGEAKRNPKNEESHMTEHEAFASIRKQLSKRWIVLEEVKTWVGSNNHLHAEILVAKLSDPDVLYRGVVSRGVMSRADMSGDVFWVFVTRKPLSDLEVLGRVKPKSNPKAQNADKLWLQSLAEGDLAKVEEAIRKEHELRGLVLVHFCGPTREVDVYSTVTQLPYVAAAREIRWRIHSDGFVGYQGKDRRLSELEVLALLAPKDNPKDKAGVERSWADFWDHGRWPHDSTEVKHIGPLQSVQGKFQRTAVLARRGGSPYARTWQFEFGSGWRAIGERRPVSELELLGLLSSEVKSNPRAEPFTSASALAKLKAIHAHRKSVLHKVVGEVPSPLQGTIAFRTLTEFGPGAYEADVVYEVVWVVYSGSRLTGGAHPQVIRELSDLEVLSLLGDEAKSNPKPTQRELYAAYKKWLTPIRRESLVWVSPVYEGRQGEIYLDVIFPGSKNRLQYHEGKWEFSRVLAPPSELELLGLLAGGTKSNPKRRKANMPLEVYDPREEQLRAQRQAIYESQVKKATGSSSFRDAKGQRVDTRLAEDERNKMIRRYMFAMGTGVQRRDARIYPGTQQFTPKALREAQQRYADVDTLVRNRQDYEETLGLARKSGFYRVTREPTQRSLAYFVWPLPPGQRVPVPLASEQAAQRRAAQLNASADPRSTRRWWQPSPASYNVRELAAWLPPQWVFALSYDPKTSTTPRRKSA